MQTAQPIVGKDQYDEKQLKDHYYDEYYSFLGCLDRALMAQ